MERFQVTQIRYNVDDINSNNVLFIFRICKSNAIFCGNKNTKVAMIIAVFLSSPELLTR